MKLKHLSSLTGKCNWPDWTCSVITGLASLMWWDYVINNKVIVAQASLISGSSHPWLTDYLIFSLGKQQPIHFHNPFCKERLLEINTSKLISLFWQQSAFCTGKNLGNIKCHLSQNHIFHLHLWTISKLSNVRKNDLFQICSSVRQGPVLYYVWIRFITKNKFWK